MTRKHPSETKPNVLAYVILERMGAADVSRYLARF